MGEVVRKHLVGVGPTACIEGGGALLHNPAGQLHDFGGGGEISINHGQTLVTTLGPHGIDEPCSLR